MGFKEDFYEKLGILQSGIPLLLTMEAKEMENISLKNSKIYQINHYFLKWGGMQKVGKKGFSENEKYAYVYFRGEVLKLDQLGKEWKNKPILNPLESVDDKGATYRFFSEMPKKILSGRTEILAGLEKNDLMRYKPLLEGLLNEITSPLI